MVNQDDKALLEALGALIQPKKVVARTPKEERIIAGFEEIQRFVEVNDHIPRHDESGDIFERLYALRLDQLRASEEDHTLLASLDLNGLIAGAQPDDTESEDDAALLSALSYNAVAPDITNLQHVRSSAEKRAVAEMASREKCDDFDAFKPLFMQVQNELERGVRETRPFKDNARIEKGNWFILHGQKAFVAEEGEAFENKKGRMDRRLRVIFDNGTESELLMFSLERALQKDKSGRRITTPNAGPLFTDTEQSDDMPSGTIYVLRSKSDNPLVIANREVLHKIGVTSGSVKRRIANAVNDSTYLMADVEIVATYELFNIHRTKLENLIHKFFGAAQLDIEVPDARGNPIYPKEWFLVPFAAIEETIERVIDGTISEYRYDLESARLVKAE